MDSLRIFTALGYSESEHQIYRTLLESGPLSVADIAKKTNLHRPTVYQLIPHLIDRQLVSSVVKGKRTVFSAESPETLKKAFDDVSTEIQAAIPELLELYTQKSVRPVIRFFDGPQGLRFVFNDVVHSLKKGDVFYRYSSKTDEVNAEKYMPSDYRAIRDAKQLERFVISNETTARTKGKRLERATKLVPKEMSFDLNVTQIIYGNKVAILDYNTEQALIIENTKIAEFQKTIFKLLYAKL